MTGSKIISQNDSSSVAGRVGETNGTVTVTRNTDEREVTQAGDQVYINDVLTTSPNSKALIYVGEEGAVFVGQSKTVQFSEDFIAQVVTILREAKSAVSLGDPTPEVSVEEIFNRTSTEDFFNRTSSEELLSRVSVEDLASGVNLEETFAAPAAGPGFTARTPDPDVTSESENVIVFWARTGGSLIPVSGFNGLVEGSEENVIGNQQIFPAEFEPLQESILVSSEGGSGVQIKLVALNENGEPLLQSDGQTYTFINDVVEGGVIQFMALAFDSEATQFTTGTQLLNQEGSVLVNFSNGPNVDGDYDSSPVRVTLGVPTSVETNDDFLADNNESFNASIVNDSYIAPLISSYDSVLIDTSPVTTTIRDDSGTPYTPDDGPEADHEVIQIKLVALGSDKKPLFDVDGKTYLFANTVKEGDEAKYMALAFAQGTTEFTADTKLADAEQVGSVVISFADGSATSGSDYSGASITAILGEVISTPTFHDNNTPDTNETFTAFINAGSYASANGAYENVIIDSSPVTTTVRDMIVFDEDRSKYVIDVSATTVKVTHIETGVETSVLLTDADTYEFNDVRSFTSDPNFADDTVDDTDKYIITSGSGNDTIILKEGDNKDQKIKAGEGDDTVKFAESRDKYIIGEYIDDCGKFFRVRNIETGADETHFIYDVETMIFNGISFSLTGNAAKSIDNDTIKNNDVASINLLNGVNVFHLYEGDGKRQFVEGGAKPLSAEEKDTVVFSHARGDYTFGFRVVNGNTIYTSYLIATGETNVFKNIDFFAFGGDVANPVLVEEALVDDTNLKSTAPAIFLGDGGTNSITLNSAGQNVTGGTGDDTVIFSGDRKNYTVGREAFGSGFRYRIIEVDTGTTFRIVDNVDVFKFNDIEISQAKGNLSTFENDTVSGTNFHNINLGSGTNVFTYNEEPTGPVSGQMVTGGSGTDTVVFAGRRDEYTITQRVVSGGDDAYDIRNIATGETNRAFGSVENFVFKNNGVGAPTQLTPSDAGFVDSIIYPNSDDNIVGNITAPIMVDGGAGIDTLLLPQDSDIDFSTLPNTKFQNIENIDLSQHGSHTLDKLSLADVIAFTDSSNILTIFGDSGDEVKFKAGDNWVKGSTVTENGHVFDIYTNPGEVALQVKVEQDIQDQIL